MAKQEQVQKPAPQTREQDAQQLAEQDAEVQAAQEKPAADLSYLDDLLDEIDAVLEEQDVLTNFRQKGGE